MTALNYVKSILLEKMDQYFINNCFFPKTEKEALKILIDSHKILRELNRYNIKKLKKKEIFTYR
jgi:hypothetical protein